MSLDPNQSRFQRYLGRRINALRRELAEESNAPTTSGVSIDSALGETANRSTSAIPENLKRRSLHTLTYALKQADYGPEICSWLLALAPLMERAGHRFDWLPYLEKGIGLSQDLGDLEMEAQLSLYIGYVYQLCGDYEDAYSRFQICVMMTRQLANPTYQSRALNCLAYIAKLQRRFDEAYTLVSQALTLIDAPKHGEKAHAFFILGTLAMEEGNHEKAVRYFSDALEIRISQNEPHKMARCYRGLGTAYYAWGKYNEAIQFTEKAIDLFRQQNDVVELAVAQMNLGTLWLSKGKTKKARELYQQAEPTLHQSADKQHLAIMHHNMGYSYAQEEAWHHAIAVLPQSANIKEELNDVAGLVNTLEELGAAYVHTNRDVDAKQVFQKALALISELEDKYLHEKYYESIVAHLKALGVCEI